MIWLSSGSYLYWEVKRVRWEREERLTREGRFDGGRRERERDWKNKK